MRPLFIYIEVMRLMVLPEHRMLFEILRLALDGSAKSSGLTFAPSVEQWKKIYALAKQQSVLGVAYRGAEKLPAEGRPPMDLLFRWAADAEAIRGVNSLMNREAARVTQVFESAGRRTAILKGQANARLYPDPLARQAGDIDIWVEGGRKSVDELLCQLGLLELDPDNPNTCRHHVHLERTKDNIMVEVHYMPASGNPYKAGKLQAFLNEEILKAELVPEGFYAPSLKFALVMQLSHLQQHFFSGGLGLRQYADYFILLRHSSAEVRQQVAAAMKRMHMVQACSAVMWVLGEVFGLEREFMLCSPCAWRGKKLLNLALKGGNFGKYILKPHNVFVRWARDRLQALSWLPFDPPSAVCKELRYWRATISLIPLRIKRRRIAL